MYLREPEVRHLLRRLTDHFRTGELIFDGVPPWVATMTQLMKKHLSRWYVYPAYWTAIDDGSDIERWNLRLHHRDQRRPHGPVAADPRPEPAPPLPGGEPARLVEEVPPRLPRRVLNEIAGRSLAAFCRSFQTGDSSQTGTHSRPDTLGGMVERSGHSARSCADRAVPTATAASACWFSFALPSRGLFACTSMTRW